MWFSDGCEELVRKLRGEGLWLLHRRRGRLRGPLSEEGDLAEDFEGGRGEVSEEGEETVSFEKEAEESPAIEDENEAREGNARCSEDHELSTGTGRRMNVQPLRFEGSETNVARVEVPRRRDTPTTRKI